MEEGFVDGKNFNKWEWGKGRGNSTSKVLVGMDNRVYVYVCRLEKWGLLSEGFSEVLNVVLKEF